MLVTDIQCYHTSAAADAGSLLRPSRAEGRERCTGRAPSSVRRMLLRRSRCRSRSAASRAGPQVQRDWTLSRSHRDRARVQSRAGRTVFGEAPAALGCCSAAAAPKARESRRCEGARYTVQILGPGPTPESGRTSSHPPPAGRCKRPNTNEEGAGRCKRLNTNEEGGGSTPTVTGHTDCHEPHKGGGGVAAWGVPPCAGES